MARNEPQTEANGLPPAARVGALYYRGSRTVNTRHRHGLKYFRPLNVRFWSTPRTRRRRRSNTRPNGCISTGPMQGLRKHSGRPRSGRRPLMSSRLRTKAQRVQRFRTQRFRTQRFRTQRFRTRRPERCPAPRRSAPTAPPVGRTFEGIVGLGEVRPCDPPEGEVERVDRPLWSVGAANTRANPVCRVVIAGSAERIPGGQESSRHVRTLQGRRRVRRWRLDRRRRRAAADQCIRSTLSSALSSSCNCCSWSTPSCTFVSSR